MRRNNLILSGVLVHAKRLPQNKPNKWGEVHRLIVQVWELWREKDKQQQHYVLNNGDMEVGVGECVLGLRFGFKGWGWF